MLTAWKRLDHFQSPNIGLFNHQHFKYFSPTFLFAWVKRMLTETMCANREDSKACLSVLYMRGMHPMWGES